MLIVTGFAEVQRERMDEALTLSREHVARSRTEPGCLEHGVYLDPNNRARLFFFERWADRAALDAHFAVPESIAFVRALSGLAAAPLKMSVMEATMARAGDVQAPPRR